MPEESQGTNLELKRNDIVQLPYDEGFKHLVKNYWWAPLLTGGLGGILSGYNAARYTKPEEKEDPEARSQRILRKAMLGAGLGASVPVMAGLGAAGIMVSEDNKPPRPSLLSRLITIPNASGAAGGVLPLLSKSIRDFSFRNLPGIGSDLKKSYHTSRLREILNENNIRSNALVGYKGIPGYEALDNFIKSVNRGTPHAGETSDLKGIIRTMRDLIASRAKPKAYALASYAANSSDLTLRAKGRAALEGMRRKQIGSKLDNKLIEEMDEISRLYGNSYRSGKDFKYNAGRAGRVGLRSAVGLAPALIPAALGYVSGDKLMDSASWINE